MTAGVRKSFLNSSNSQLYLQNEVKEKQVDRSLFFIQKNASVTADMTRQLCIQ